MSLSVFEDHRRHVATVERGNLLGRIAWFSCSTTRVPHATVKKILDEAGLGHIISKRGPADIDVFRRVFQNGARREFSTGDPDVTENLLIREVVSTPERVVRRIVRELVDSRGEKLDFDEVLDLRFNKSHPERIDINVVEGGTFHESAWSLAQELAGQYRDERGCLNGKNVRDVIRRGLDACRATSVRENGAVYFVLEDYADQLAALERVADLVPGATLHTLPLIDDRKQRDLIRSAFESEAAEALRKLEIDLDAALANPVEDSDAFVKLQARLAPVMDKARQYAQVLEDEAGLETLQIQIVSTKLNKLFMKGFGA